MYRMDTYKQFAVWGGIGGKISARTRARRLLKAKNRTPQPKVVLPLRHRGPKPSAIISDRNREIAEKFLSSSYTLSDLGAEYGMTRERVRQILYKQNISSDEGGRMKNRLAHAMSEGAAQEAARNERKIKSCHSYMMCDPGAYSEITGKDWISEARAAPIAKAYFNQRKSAKGRKIEWNLTFPQWYDIWRSSGKLDERGRGQGKYVMARKFDLGGYVAGNIYICLATENNSERNDKKYNLPMGVKSKGNKYEAIKMIGGKSFRVGIFDTPEEASAAYQAFTGEKPKRSKS